MNLRANNPGVKAANHSTDKQPPVRGNPECNGCDVEKPKNRSEHTAVEIADGGQSGSLAGSLAFGSSSLLHRVAKKFVEESHTRRSRLTFRAQARRTNTVAERSWRDGCHRSRSDSAAKYCYVHRRCLQRFVRHYLCLLNTRTIAGRFV